MDRPDFRSKLVRDLIPELVGTPEASVATAEVDRAVWTTSRAAGGSTSGNYPSTAKGKGKGRGLLRRRGDPKSSIFRP